MELWWTFASLTSASKRSKLHQRAHRRCFYLRQQRGGGVGLNQPLWAKQPCKVHLIKAKSHKAGKCSTVSNKTSSHPCFDSYTVGKRRNVSLYAQTSAVTSTWLRNSLGHRTTTGRTSPAHLVQRWQHITRKRRREALLLQLSFGKTSLLLLFVRQVQSSSHQDLTIYFSKCNTKHAEPRTVCSRSPAWQFIWPVPCPRRQSVSIRPLCWPDYLYVAQPPSEQLWPESHPGDSLLRSDGQRQKKSTWNRLFRWSRFIFSAATEETDGAGADARRTREGTSSQSAARMLLWLYSLTLLWCNCNFSQTHMHSLQQLSHSESLGHKSKWKSSLLVPWRSTVIVSLSGSLGRGNVF